MAADTKNVGKFKGLNNVSDPLRLGMGWLSQADNVDITDSGAIRRRDGYSLALACAPSGAFSTFDFKRMYVVDAGDLKRVNEDMTTTTLRSEIGPAPMYWAEVNEQVYFSNGVDKGIILPSDEVIDWGWPDCGTPDLNAITGNLPAGIYQVACTFLTPDGRETGAGDAAMIDLTDGQAISISNIPQTAGFGTLVYIASADSAVFQLAFQTSLTAMTWNSGPDALGVELMTQFLDPPPTAAVIPAFWQGKMYLMEYLPAQDMTVVWISEPLGYHLFGLNDSFLPIPGQGVMLAATPDGLIIGSLSKIYSWDGDTLKTLADYGAVPGWGVAVDEDKSILFWTNRGICAALPFSNLTLNSISVSSGLRAGAAIVRSNGAKKYVVALQRGGENFNERGKP